MAEVLSMAGVATQLGIGLLRGVAGKGGALLIEEFMPAGVPTYFDRVYEEITRIVKAEVQANTVAEIDGHLKGIVGYVQHEYPSDVRQHPDRALEKLDEYILTLRTDVLGPLEEEAFRKPGLSVYLIAGGLHLALLQEQAVRERTAPGGETYLEPLRRYAADQARAGRLAWGEVRADRETAVSLEEGRKLRQSGGYASTVQSWYWSDAVSGFKSSRTWEDGDAKADATAARDERREMVLIDLDARMSRPATTLARWELLGTYPLPGDIEAERRTLVARRDSIDELWRALSGPTLSGAASFADAYECRTRLAAADPVSDPELSAAINGLLTNDLGLGTEQVWEFLADRAIARLAVLDRELKQIETRNHLAAGDAD
jgi:hypothetical protein